MGHSYQALYRTWRPQRFAEVVGQEHVVRTLLNALRSGRIAHAYLFAGPRGTGKTSVAKLLAKAVNCQQPADGEPCNRCPICQEINEGSTMDVLEIDAASNRGIDEIRDLRERIGYVPARARYKAYIIDEVHMLTSEAFNALLKTLEEPPDHALFILATTEPHRIPATILSRCQRFDFHRLNGEQIVGRLSDVCQALGITVDSQALRLLARRADGGLRDALSLLDQCVAMTGQRLTVQDVVELLGLPSEDRILALMTAVARGDLGDGLRTLAALSAEGCDLAQVLQDWLVCWRDLLAVQSGLGADQMLYLSPERWDQLRQLSLEMDGTTALACMDALVEAQTLLRWSAQPRLALEAALIRAVGVRTGANTPRELAAGREGPATTGEPAAPAEPRRGSRGRGEDAGEPAGGDDPNLGQAVLGTRRKADGASSPPASLGEPATHLAQVHGTPPAARRLVAEWDRFLATLRQRREWTALAALLRRAGRPRVVGTAVEIPFAQEGMARTAESKQAALQRAVSRYLGEPTAVRIVVDKVKSDRADQGAAAGAVAADDAQSQQRADCTGGSPSLGDPRPSPQGSEPEDGGRRGMPEDRQGVRPEESASADALAPSVPEGNGTGTGTPPAQPESDGRPTSEGTSRRVSSAGASALSSSSAAAPSVEPGKASGGEKSPSSNPARGTPDPLTPPESGSGSGSSKDTDGDRILALAQELLGGEWIPMEEEWQWPSAT